MSDQSHKEPPPIPGYVLDLVEESHADACAALDQLILEVEAAKNVPLSNSVMLPREEFIERMRSVRSNVDRLLSEAVSGLPEELRAARWMVREREAYVARTNENAREMLAKAKQRSEELVSESHIVAEAVEEANTLVRNSEKQAEKIRLEAEDVAERSLSEAEAVLGELLRYVQESRAALHEPLPPADEVPLSQ
jgi:cell division septum initiation protein DivIVA